MTDNIIKFDPDVKPPWLTVGKKSGKCKHRRISVCKEDRLLICEDCEAPLDPITVLDDIAREERRFYYHAEELKRMRKLVASLKDDERRTKARLRNAKKKLASQCEEVDVCPTVKKYHDACTKLSRELLKHKNKNATPTRIYT